MTEENYWTTRYNENNTGWDLSQPSPPITTFFNAETDTELRILIPGAGNAYEAEYLFDKGFRNVHVMDVSKKPLQNLQNRSPHFPSKQILHGDFFEHQGSYDLIIEQTFFCSFEPTPQNRLRYFEKMSNLLKPDGRLIGLWFNHPLTKDSKRPFGGNRNEYIGYAENYFHVEKLEPCMNSIDSRQGRELFGIFQKK